MTCRNRRCMLILVTVAVIATMSISLGAASYDPQASYNYAQKYAYTAVSDGHFYDKDGIPIHIPAGTPIINDGLDCAHFVSSAIGNQQNEKGGGLDIYSATKLPYGSASTTGLWNYLIDKKLGVKVSSGVEANDILQLERGDIINYDFPNDGKGWSHTALYLGDGLIAAHTSSQWNGDWKMGSGTKHRFIHIKGVATNEWEFNTPKIKEGWFVHNIKSWSVESDGKFRIDPNLIDPWIESPSISVSANNYNVIQINMASNAPGQKGAIYFKTSDSPAFSEDKKVAFSVNNGGGFRDYSILMNQNPLWKGTITGIRVDPSNTGKGDNTDIVGFDYIRLKLQNSLTYAISVSTSPIGLNPPPTGGGTYNSGTSRTIVAQPVTGYTFQKWTENGNQVSATASYTFTVTGNRNLVAVYIKSEQPVYNTAFLTDEQLEDYGSMTTEQIREFLVGYNSYFKQDIKDVDGQIFDPSIIIAEAALQYHINPKVILTTLEKESSGVTRTSRPSDITMKSLLGCMSPSTARQQLACAAERFRTYNNQLTNNGQTTSGWKIGTPKLTVDGVTVTPATKAVAGQFTYTPYAGAQWGGNQPKVGGTYLFYYAWNKFDFSTTVPTTPAPQITSISPTQIVASVFDLTINGLNFDSGAIDQIYWKADMSFIGKGIIASKTGTKIVTEESMAGIKPGVYVVKVKNSDGQLSNGMDFTITAPLSVQYQAHFANTGWMNNWVQDGQTAGTLGGNQMEAIRIQTSNYDITYRAHVANDGWLSWVSNGADAGTTGQGKSLQAIEIKLENAPSNLHVNYRVYVHGQGWKGWVSDGATAGTTGLGLAVDAIEIKIQN